MTKYVFVTGGVVSSLGKGIASASLGAIDATGHRPALYEPVHGSAPDIAGQGKANPIGAILSLALLLRHSAGLPDDAAMLEAAVADALAAGARTVDIAAPGEPVLGTAAMGDAVLAALETMRGARG